ncbi:MAG: valine--tRNA ligase [Clostridia bacterium]|nr:valine--tRNA ligase [Clostridia bacterium]
MNSKYNPLEIEDKIYKMWEEKDYFKPVIDKSKKPFVIVIPPPNVTGQLHMGHALDETIQDIFIRYNRMKGVPTLWLPGTDHASIATEMKVVEKLKKEGKTKDELGREGFLEEAWAWKNQYGDRIVNQLKKLGASCDWSRERFTMDEGLSKAVEYVFVKLYEKGLIYKGERIVNWCTHCGTSISDNEVEYTEEESNLWHIEYKTEDGKSSIVVATTRPETMLGDTAIAVNPEDERYKKIIGKNVVLPIVGRKIPVIADEYVEKEFGTGAVKITPAHDPNDYEVGQRHGLEVISVIDEKGIIAEGYGKFSGLTREEARKAIVEELENTGALVKTEKYSHNVGKCYRCNTTIEPYASKQWFVAMKDLAAPAIEAVRNKEVRFVPERFEKTYMNWMENIRDWCISRQLWWGHRIPAYYCEKCGKMEVTMDKPVDCSCGGKFVQDEDVLDTWFSSALWPFSTLGWPEKTEDLEYFYPTSMLVTGYDIITFWVSKMIFSAIEHTGVVPFKDVFIHGLVRDSQGRKMSKSLGNGVDPLEVIDQYGTDALRFSLIQNIAPGNDIRYIPEKVEAGRNFANKLWNAARFTLTYTSKEANLAINEQELYPEDKWILTKLSKIIANVRENIEKYEIGVALGELYDFVWSDFCDLYIEMAKSRLYDEAGSGYKAAVSTLNYVLENILKLLHPYMPYITEEIYGYIKNRDEALIIAEYPEPKYSFDIEFNFEQELIEVIRQVRNARATAGLTNSKKINAAIATNNQELLEKSVPMIKKLCGIEELIIGNISAIDGTAIHTQNIDIVLDLSVGINKEEQNAKVQAEIAKAEAELKRAQGMLANEKFVSKAPPALIEAEKEKVKKYTDIISKLKESLK